MVLATLERRLRIKACDLAAEWDIVLLDRHKTACV